MDQSTASRGVQNCFLSTVDILNYVLLVLTLSKMVKHSICYLNKLFNCHTEVSVDTNSSSHDRKPWHVPLCILGVTVCATYPFSNLNIVQSVWAANRVQRQKDCALGFQDVSPGLLFIIWWSVIVDF